MRAPGIEHPLLKTMNEIVAVFHHLGYSTALGPQVESDFYNFEALNFPPNHPARDTQDTLVLAGQQAKPSRDRLLMRTHTSPVQIRTMIAEAPPIRIVVPGKVHRNDAADATHSPVFHQVEGLCVDTNITFSDLKGTLDHAMKALFGSGVKTRFFPSFFPVHRAQRRRADQLHLLRAARAAASASTRAGLSCSAAAWSTRRSSPASTNSAWRRAKQPRTIRQKVSGLCLRHGRGADRDDPARRLGDRAVLLGRHALSGAICVKRRVSKLASQRVSRSA